VSRSRACRPLLGMNRFVVSAVVLAACTGTTSPVITDLAPHERVWVSGVWGTSGRAGLLDAHADLPMFPATVVPSSGELADQDPDDDVSNLDGDFSVTPDGNHLAYVATDGTTETVYVANGDGSDRQQVFQTTASIWGLSLSPNAGYLALFGDLSTPQLTDCFVIDLAHPLDGPTQLSPERAEIDPTLRVVANAVWSRDSRYIAFAGAFTDYDFFELDVVDLGAGLSPIQRSTVLSRAQILTPATAMPGPKGAIDPVFDAADRLWFGAFVADADVPQRELYVALPGQPSTKVSLPTRGDTTAPNIEAFAVSPDGLHIAYAADAPVAMSYEIYYATTSTPTTATRLGSGGTPATYYDVLAFSPDGSQLAATANLANPMTEDLYVFDVDGGSPIQLSANGDADIIGRIQWSEGPSLWCTGDLGSNGVTNPALYRFDVTGGIQTPELAFDVGTIGSVEDVQVR
jgi:hypothetical protein